MATLVEIALFQDAMMAVFLESDSVAEVLERLAADSAFEPFQTEVTTWKPEMIETAMAIVKKWAQRVDGRAEGL